MSEAGNGNTGNREQGTGVRGQHSPSLVRREGRCCVEGCNAAALFVGGACVECAAQIDALDTWWGKHHSANLAPFRARMKLGALLRWFPLACLVGGALACLGYAIGDAVREFIANGGWNQ